MGVALPALALKRTPLYALHQKLGARMVSFGGWEMPVQYESIVEEHRAVRTAAGLFDVSHMGEVLLSGPRATEALQTLTPNDVAHLMLLQVQYSALLTEAGTVVDDLTIYKYAEDRYMLTVNAANIEKDEAWIRGHLQDGVSLENVSAETALLALQGPQAQGILQTLTPLRLDQIGYYRFAVGKVTDVEATVSRTGYTGEDGFEVYGAASAAETLWTRILDAGRPQGLRPVGLGARDTLRLEARMLLYGNDMDEEHTLLEAGVGWIVKWDKGDFLGRAALARQREEGLRRRLVGFEMVGRGIARQHYPVMTEGRVIGEVTSGGPAPSLGKNIGLAYVAAEYAEVGTEWDVLIRKIPVRARVVPTPFYKRKR